MPVPRVRITRTDTERPLVLENLNGADAMIKRLFTARGCLIETAHERLKVARVARQHGFSVFHFSRVFQATFGESPREVVIETRLSHAKNLLLNTELPVTEICFECGYESLGSFSHLFRLRTGLSPRDFRQQRSRFWPVNISFIQRFVPLCLIEAFR